MVSLITRQMDGCAAKCKTPYALSQAPAAARVGGPALLPVTAVGDLCLGGAPAVVALAGCGQVWVGCLQMLQGEWFGSTRGGLSCFRLELGEEASFPCVESIALHVTVMPAAVVYLVESRAECAVCTCSAPCAAQVMCPKPQLQDCVESFPPSAPSPWPVC